MTQSSQNLFLTTRDNVFCDAVMARVSEDFDFESRPKYLTLGRALVEVATVAAQEWLADGELSDQTRQRLLTVGSEATNVMPLDVVDEIDVAFTVEALDRWPDETSIIEIARRIGQMFYGRFWPDEDPKTIAAAARFGTLANTLPVPVFMARPDGRITFTSFGLDSLLGLIPGEAEQYAMADLFGTTLSLGSDQPNRLEMSVSGVERHLMITVLPVETEMGTEYFGICEDITREHALEEMRDGVVNAISHQLRTPLTAIVGYLDLLSSDSLPAEETAEALSVAHREAEDLLGLVTNIVDFSKLTAGTAYMALEPVRLVAEVSAVFDELFEYETEPSVDIPFDLVMSVDRSRLNRLLRGLLDNARIHGGPKIRVEARRRVSGVEIVIGDDGDGISDEAAARAASPFVRSVDDGMTGVGLGLAISNGIMLCHGGTLTIESDGGAVVTAWFPSA